MIREGEIGLSVPFLGHLWSASCPVFNWIAYFYFFFYVELNEMLYMLDINPLLVILFANIFSY